MSGPLHRGERRRNVPQFRHQSEVPSANRPSALPPPSDRRRLAPDELHAQRVAWGQRWGKLISDATKRWKGEL